MMMWTKVKLAVVTIGVAFAAIVGLPAALMATKSDPVFRTTSLKGQCTVQIPGASRFTAAPPKPRSCAPLTSDHGEPV